MCGALSVMGVGAVLLNLDGRIVACDQRFAQAAGLPIHELIGMSASDLAHPDDRTKDTWLAQRALEAGDSFTTLTHRIDGVGPLYENHVVQLFGGESPLILSISRPSECRADAPPGPSGVPSDEVADYVADLGRQFAQLAAKAHMPVTVDLFMAAAAAAEMEAGIDDVIQTAA